MKVGSICRQKVNRVDLSIHRDDFEAAASRHILAEGKGYTAKQGSRLRPTCGLAGGETGAHG